MVVKQTAPDSGVLLQCGVILVWSLVRVAVFLFSRTFQFLFGVRGFLRMNVAKFGRNMVKSVATGEVSRFAKHVDVLTLVA